MKRFMYVVLELMWAAYLGAYLAYAGVTVYEYEYWLVVLPIVFLVAVSKWAAKRLNERGD